MGLRLVSYNSISIISLSYVKAIIISLSYVQSYNYFIIVHISCSRFALWYFLSPLGLRKSVKDKAKDSSQAADIHTVLNN
jgi:hypothetical protein